ncbi:helix-turn-helix transcriptional regulator [Methylobacterium terricola]|uniref:Helix-turn-helix transcriptional regulator n=1 Tax=Methylobacterium terricola TaxID=2583531 RepID=A0A5C4LK27_9HYPH|nr:helix-turn-helix transcriptional regulator [Methylobacterium terricola]TNC14847.1 helix-turn-helix transcriptional regulator [Methylobacterium terricola]
MNGGDDITAAQLRRARDLLGWSEDALALRANVDAASIRQFEEGHYPPSPEQRAAIRGALVAAGIELTNGADPDARLRPEDALDKGIHPSELTTENDR